MSVTNYQPRDLGFLTVRVLEMTQPPPYRCPTLEEARRLVAGAESEPWFPQLLDELARWHVTANRMLSSGIRYAIPDYLRDRVEG